MAKLMNFSLCMVAGAAILAASTLPAFAQESDLPEIAIEQEEIVVNIPDAPPVPPEMAPMPEPPPPGGPMIGMGPQGLPPQVAAAHACGKSKCPVIGGMKCPVMGGKCGISSILTGDNALTDDQYEQLFQLKNEMMDQMGPKMLEYKTHKRHLKDMMTKETLDEKAIKKINGQAASLKGDMTAIKMDFKLKMAQVLTPEQRKALRTAMIKSMGKGKWKKRMCKKMMMMRRWRGR